MPRNTQPSIPCGTVKGLSAFWLSVSKMATVSERGQFDNYSLISWVTSREGMALKCGGDWKDRGDESKGTLATDVSG